MPLNSPSSRPAALAKLPILPVDSQNWKLWGRTFSRFSLIRGDQNWSCTFTAVKGTGDRLAGLSIPSAAATAARVVSNSSVEVVNMWAPETNDGCGRAILLDASAP